MYTNILLHLDVECDSNNYTLALNRQEMDIRECDHEECASTQSETDLLLEEQNNILKTYSDAKCNRLAADLDQCNNSNYYCCCDIHYTNVLTQGTEFYDDPEGLGSSPKFRKPGTSEFYDDLENEVIFRHCC